jgi:hypothetical protein
VDTGSNDLVSLSCHSSTLCVAVDYTDNRLSYNGHTWSAPHVLGPSESGLISVSCPRATFCAVVGNSGYFFYDATHTSPV